MKKRRRISLLAAALLLGLCGCQQKEPENQEEIETGKDAAAVWKEQWTAELDGGKKIPVEMDCEIADSDSPPDSSIDTQPMEFHSQRKEQMAKGVFGGEVYLYDWEHMCEADLQKRLVREENILKWELPELEYLQEKPTKEGNAYRRKTKKELQGRVDRVKELLKKAPKDPVKAEDGAYDGDSYMGYVGDTAYRLEFNRDLTAKKYDFYDEISLEWDTSGLARTIELLSINVEDFAPEELADSWKLTGGDLSSNELSFNECSLSEEEAQQKAEDMLKKLGFSNMVKTEVKGLAWKEMGTSYKKSVVDGYIFWFQTGIEGNILQLPGNKLDRDLPYGRERVQVQVNDKGVVRVRIDAPIQVDNITPDIELLEIEDVKDMLKTQLPDYIRAYKEYCEEGLEEDEEEVSVNNFKGAYLQLIYCRINDPGNAQHFTYVPVWELTGSFDRVNMVKFYMNAIDGSYVTLDPTPWTASLYGKIGG